MSLLLLLRSSPTGVVVPPVATASTSVLAPNVSGECLAPAQPVRASTVVLGVALPGVDPELLGVLSGATVTNGRMTGRLT